MKSYARVQNGVVAEILPAIYAEGGQEFAPDTIYSAEVVAQLVEVPEGVNVVAGSSYAAGVFSDPAPYVPPLEEVLSMVALVRDSRLSAAALAIAPLQDAVDLEMATAEEVAALTAWKQYRIAVNRIDQQAGFPQVIDWPQPPA